jgi:hypothetical protein
MEMFQNQPVEAGPELTQEYTLSPAKFGTSGDSLKFNLKDLIDQKQIKSGKTTIELSTTNYPPDIIITFENGQTQTEHLATFLFKLEVEGEPVGNDALALVDNAIAYYNHNTSSDQKAA